MSTGEIDEMSRARLEKVQELIDKSTFEEIMQKSENDPTLRVTDTIFEFASGKGDNYGSDMFRVTVEFARSSGQKEKKSVIIKVQPLLDGPQKDVILQSPLFETEIQMLTNALEKMNEYLGPEDVVSGRLLHTRSNPSLMVMEDLKPMGFRMANRLAGFDEKHAILGIRGLARFHASSVLFCEKDPTQKTKYKYGLFHEKQSHGIQEYIARTTKNLAQTITKWPELDPKLSEKLEKLTDEMYKRGIEASKCREDEFAVINHGDAWVNNLLFKYNDDNEVIDMIFVDFQLSNYTSPALDLLYFFNANLSDDLLQNNEKSLLEEYHRTLSATMAKLGCHTKPPTIQELEKALTERAVIAMITSCLILPILLSEKAEETETDELFEEDSGQGMLLEGKAYRKAITRRLPKFDKMGLLD